MTRDEAAKIQPPHIPHYSATNKLDPTRCCASVASTESFFSYQCSRGIKTRYGDLGYCGIHDPVKVKAKRDERRARWDAERKARTERWAAQERRQAFLTECERAVRAIAAGHNDPMTLCKEVLDNEH